MFKNWDIDSDERKDFNGEIIEIPKSKNGYVRNGKIYGKSVQETSVQGKNLFDINRPYTINPRDSVVGNTLVVYTNRATSHGVKYRLKCNFGLSYTVSFNVSLYGEANETWGQIIDVSSNTVIGEIWSNGPPVKRTVTAISDGEVSIEFARTGGTTHTDGHAVFSNIQAELGSTATPYEPFTPNSPSPNYPSEIKTVPSELDITSCGENLLTAAQFYAGNSSYSEISFEGRNCIRYVDNIGKLRWYGFIKPNTRYTIRFDYTIREQIAGGGKSNLIEIKYTDGTMTRVNRPKTNDWLTETVVTTAGKTIDRIGTTSTEYRNYVYIDKDTFMIKEGTDSTYTPYIGSTTPITLRDTDGNLHTPKSLPDGTRDEVDLDGGESVERVGERVLNGSESGWQKYFADGADSVRFNLDGFFLDYLPIGEYSYAPSFSIFCDRFEPGNAVDLTPDGDYFRLANTSNPRLWIKIAKSRLVGFDTDMTNAEKVQLFRNWLAENPVTIDYVCEPKPWTLHPDECKKIITVDSDKAYIYTNAEVQPELSVNVISYGDDET